MADVRSPEGPAPSDPEAATTREFVGPSRWADAKDWTWLQVGRGRWVTARAEADRRIIVVELRGRAAVGETAPPPVDDLMTVICLATTLFATYKPHREELEAIGRVEKWIDSLAEGSERP